MTENGSPFIEPFDDKAFMLIGRIIAAWSDIHEEIDSSIYNMQRRIYIYQKRKWASDNADRPWIRFFGRDEHLMPNNYKFKFRKKYYYILVRALSDNDPDVEKKLQLAVKDLTRLYEVRNTLAHGRISMGPRLGVPYITAYAEQWNKDIAIRRDKAFREFDPVTMPSKVRDAVLRLAGPVRFTLNELGAVLTDMQATLNRLRMIDPDRDDVVPELPEPPR